MLGPSRAVGGVPHVKSTVVWWICTQILVDLHPNSGGFAPNFWWVVHRSAGESAPDVTAQEQSSRAAVLGREVTGLGIGEADQSLRRLVPEGGVLLTAGNRTGAAGNRTGAAAAAHPIRWNNDRVGADPLRDFSPGDYGAAPLSTGPPRPHPRVQALEQRNPLPATAVCAAGGRRQRRSAQSIPGRHRAHTPGTTRGPVFREC